MGGLARAGALTFGFNALALVANLVSGILVARLLGSSGRGQLVAILTLAQIGGWLFAMGCQQAVSYHEARHPEDAGRLVASWLVILLPLGVLGVLVIEALLPTVLAAQSPDTRDLARVFVLTVVLTLLWELFSGVVLGDHDFLFFNVVVFAQPAGVAVIYVALWQLDALSVRGALAAFAAVTVAALAVTIPRVLRRHGLGRPSLALARSSLGYGVRAHGTNIGGLANTRLDLLIMPAILAATSVGLYSVSTNLATIVLVLAGALYPLVLPAAARRGEQGVTTVIRSLHATLAIAVVLGTGMCLVADLGIRLVYGAEFADSALPLRLLLPGVVLYAGAGVLIAGLNASNRPLTATAAQAAGLVITAAGLLLFLPSGGITAAAVVSTASYGVVFLTALAMYRRVAGLDWRAFVPSGTDLVYWRGALRLHRRRSGAELP